MGQTGIVSVLAEQTDIGALVSPIDDFDGNTGEKEKKTQLWNKRTGQDTRRTGGNTMIGKFIFANN